MKKDIEITEAKDIAIAIIPEALDGSEKVWCAYFINLKETPVTDVLINATGRGRVNGEERHTATLRFFLNRVEGKSTKKFEIVLPEAFALNNQYWVSYYEGREIFEKKFIFAANTVYEDRLVIVPILEKPGVVIK